MRKRSRGKYRLTRRGDKKYEKNGKGAQRWRVKEKGKYEKNGERGETIERGK